VADARGERPARLLGRCVAALNSTVGCVAAAWNNSVEHTACKAPNVLSCEDELVLDGRSLPRPVNYGLVRVVPLYFSLKTMTTTGYCDIIARAPAGCATTASRSNSGAVGHF
jgi:uncharacterized protein DUF3141